MKETDNLKSTLKKLFETSRSGEDFNAMAEMLKRKISKGLAYPGIREEQFYRLKTEMLSESILGPIRAEIESKRKETEDNEGRPKDGKAE